MLHEVRLPQITLERLTDVVVLQVWLLFYAASKTSLKRSDKQDLADALNRSRRFSGRGNDIASWVWIARKNRFGLLKEFAEDTSDQQDVKKAWIRERYREILVLLDCPQGQVKPFDNNAAKPWQLKANEFFISFYEDVLRDSPKAVKKYTGFPPFIFSDPNARPFGAQDFLRAFQDFNQNELIICPACDEQRYSVSSGTVQDKYGNIIIYADIDHYLPKKYYPHLACHPYNLVPTCSTCNQRKKLDKDLLKKDSYRSNLEDIFQLYREKGLVENTYLEIDISSYPAPSKVGRLVPHANYSPRECISIMEQVYCIPSGWQQVLATLEGQLFRRLSFHLCSCGASFSLPSILDSLENYFDNLVKDWGLRMNTILEAWLLDHHIQEAKTIFNQAGQKIGNTAFLTDLENSCQPAKSETPTKLDPIEDRVRRVRQAREGRNQREN
jgi:hypothetical protein